MKYRRAAAGLVLAAWVAAGTGRPAEADVVLDGTVGSRGPLQLQGQDIRITPDMGSTRGTNLFHSFKTFGVPQGDTVTFEGPAGLQRVIGRVTGPDSTQIHGTLRSTIPEASVWLLNPNGLVVGKTGVIDVPGALRLSTADELRFEDGSTYSARDVAGSQLTAANPRAFGFLGGPIGTLSVEAPSLEVGSASLTDFVPSSLALVGGRILIAGTQLKVAGPILIAAQASAGEVELVAPRVSARDGQIAISNGAAVSAVLLAGSTIRIEGGEFQLDHAQILPISLVEAGDPAAATIGLDLAAISVRLTGNGVEGTQISSGGLLGGAPYVTVAANDILVDNAGIASSPVFGAAAGNVTIIGDTIVLSNNAVVGTPALTGSEGAGGQTTIAARDKLTIRSDAQINSVTTSDLDGGDVVLVVGDLEVADGAAISTSNLPLEGVGGNGTAGSIVVSATGKVSLSGGALINAFTANATAGGNIAILAKDIKIEQGAQVTTATVGSGNAGAIQLQARNITIGSGGIVDAQSNATGQAGQILVRADEELRLDGGIISTSALQASGGGIDIEAGRRIILQNDGLILTAIVGAQEGERAGGIVITGTDGGDVGNVAIDATSGIAANAPNVGDGGTVQINSDGLIAISGNIDASARQGNSGTVASTSTQTNIVSSFAGLDAQVAPTDRLLATSCDARDVASSLIVGAVQRGSQEFDPDQPLGTSGKETGCAK